MAADKSPAFQFYARDWLASDAVSMMTAEQVGVYVMLLAHAWLRPEGLPAALSSLAKLARVSAPRFEHNIWPGVAGCFYQDDSGHWFNGRLEEERRKQAEFREAASRAGRRSAEQRAFNARSRSVDVPLQRSANGNATLLSASASASAKSFPTEQESSHPPTPLTGGRPAWLWGEWRRLMHETREIDPPLSPKASDVGVLLDVCGMVADDDRLSAALERFMRLSQEQAKLLSVKVISPATFRMALPKLLEATIAAPRKWCEHDPECVTHTEHTARWLAEQRAKVSA